MSRYRVPLEAAGIVPRLGITQQFGVRSWGELTKSVPYDIARKDLA
jgi:hypothetical protein